ncbi:unnamed protein product [Moneuplotes crassus]|uniref:Sulfotransferase domain-containing protein n=1 Tax=Euplotes crassus TaxID=5936 RepID=A0AAD1U7N1_EUPCR|nr:unnamed protein product [Moneuplotes crassus]
MESYEEEGNEGATQCLSDEDCRLEIDSVGFGSAHPESEEIKSVPEVHTAEEVKVVARSSEEEAKKKPKFNKKHRSSQNPTYSLYLQEFTSIPKYLEEPKYLSKNDFEKVVLTSYPRSGNTLLRKYLEDITGIITGSDCDVKRRLNSDLVEMGMSGEGRTNHSIWVAKSHYPERYGASKFMANKCILLVRNPLDAIISLFNMIATGTHNCSMSEEDFTSFNDYFDMFVSQEIAVWRDFHSYWIDPEPDIPTYVVRYEDLLQKPEETLTELFSFLLNQNDLSGTLIEHLIKKHTSRGVKKQVYKPRVGKVNANKSKYTKDQLSQIKKLAGQMIRRMGYLETENELDKTDTGFFSDDEEVDASKDYECDSLFRGNSLRDVTMRYRYHEFNRNTLGEVCSSEHKYKVETKTDIPEVQINYSNDLIRQKSARDPSGRGSKLFREVLRGNVTAVDPDGNIVRRPRGFRKPI